MHRITPASNVLAFPKRSVENRLSNQDKADVFAWEAGAVRLGYDRVVIDQTAGERGLDYSEFVLVYRLGHPWALWGVARQARDVVMWRCSDGVQAGLYPTVRAALASLAPVSRGSIMPTGGYAKQHRP